MTSHDKSFALIVLNVIGAIYCYFQMEKVEPVVLAIPLPAQYVVANAANYECVKTKECTIKVYPTPQGTRLQLVALQEPTYEDL